MSETELEQVIRSLLEKTSTDLMQKVLTKLDEGFGAQGEHIDSLVEGLSAQGQRIESLVVGMNSIRSHMQVLADRVEDLETERRTFSRVASFGLAQPYRGHATAPSGAGFTERTAQYKRPSPFAQ